MVCRSCGKDVPGEFPFCPFCTAPLTAQPAALGQERKVVSVLFCDLVGFTAASDGADPEDVQARLRPYHERVREVLERHGGTVEKFVGDAVMAVFGAPAAHEDDAERAVRAGLRILEAIGELNEANRSLGLEVRVGVDTGEAVVTLGARPELGQGIVTGDVVNTASRLQGAAPVGAVAVSERTFRATERVFEWEPLEPVQVKGKAERLGIFRALAPRARLGSDVTRAHATPLVGRELEKPLLIGTFERAAAQQSCQLVTVVGEPGVGKSRLCLELLGYIEERPGLVRWRQGRCLPYGDGIAFWALGEIVKAECGILETDTPDSAAAKLERVLPEGDADRSWLVSRLAPLVGAGGVFAAQEESYTAWRRFCEGLAVDGPAVLVFEDLHWADPALLAFLEYLADWAAGVPLLVLCTARPELHERHPGWAGGLRNATTINLAPLTDEETAKLVAALLQRAVLPAETQEQLLARAGGNPLYAEEFVRLLTDRGSMGAETVVPESVQALIAARLDTLDAERKALLQDAAVLGKVFWAGALGEMGGRDAREVEQALHELARKELVRPARSTSMAGEAEYSFWHALVRDVCYGQIPRAARAVRHEAAASWIERKAAGRVEDLADVLAHHHLTALELTEASGGSEVAELRERAVRSLALAGERALGLDVERAEQQLARALQLALPGHPQRATLLERWAAAAQQQNRLQDARRALEEALDLQRERGDRLAEGRLLTTLSNLLANLGDVRRQEVIERAVALLEAEPPGPELVDAYAVLAVHRSLNAEQNAAVAAAEQALVLADRLGLPTPPRALGLRGVARCKLGDPEGVTDMRRALEHAIEQGEGRAAAVLYNNLAYVASLYGGPHANLDAYDEGIEFTRRRGITEFTDAMSAGRVSVLAEAGRTAEALAEAGPRADRLQAAGHIHFVEARSLQLRLLAERGLHQQAPAPDELVAAVSGSSETQVCAVAFAAAARLLHAQGREEEAHAALGELDRLDGVRGDPAYVSLLPTLVRTAVGLGDAALAGRLVDGVQPLFPLAEHALTSSRAQLAEAAGNHVDAAALHADAAEGWRQFGNVPECAYALLGHGRCLHALGDTAAGRALVAARELFAALGYEPALAETQALLDQGQLAAS